VCATNLVWVCLQIVWLSNDHFLAALQEKRESAFDLRLHAAGCEVSRSQVLPAFLYIHEVDLNLLRCAEIQ